MKDFSFIAVWEGNISQSDNNDYKEEIDKLKATLDTQKNDYDNKIKDYKRQLEEYDKKCSSFKEKYEQETAELVRKNNEEITQDIIDRRRLITISTDFMKRFIKIMVENGDTVTSNQIIGNLMRKRGTEDVESEIFAPRSGKLVWLLLDGDEISGCFGEYQVVLGVVGDESDNEDDMIKWAKNRIDEYGYLA